MSLKSAICLILTAVGAGFFLISNREVVKNELTLKCENLPKSFVGKKILLVSDLHKKRYGDNFNNIINSCKVCQPDYIFFLGDLFSRDETDMTPKYALMSRLKNIAPLYYVTGNHELGNRDCCDALCFKLSQTGVTVLRNKQTKIYCNDEFINVYGLELPLKYYCNKDGSFTNLPYPDVHTIEKMLGKPDTQQCNLLLAHNPLFFNSYAEWGSDLTFSGHCHGGIIRLPVLGGLLSPEREFFPKYTKGIYEKENNNKVKRLVVTTGLGKLRVNNPAEILLLTLTR